MGSPSELRRAVGRTRPQAASHSHSTPRAPLLQEAIKAHMYMYISDYKLYPAIFSFSLALFTPQDPKPTKMHFGRKEEEQPEDSCFPLLLLHFQTARSLFSSLSIAHVFQKAAVQTLVTAPIVDSWPQLIRQQRLWHSEVIFFFHLWNRNKIL